MLRRPLTLLALALLGCGVHSEEEDAEPATTAETTEAMVSPGSPAVRRQMDGRAFPDGVLALTWDDGPDLHTLALAEYLHREHVTATFFVIGEWNGASSDPGFGPHVRDTGHLRMPVLGELVALGHRIGNHTMHHALLGHVDGAGVVRELGDAQAALDPYIKNELRLFRAPGGDWSGAASRAMDGDEALARLVGPIRWDIDRKDWEGSVYCESPRPTQECERADGRWRVRADVISQRYFDSIESRRRGVVLLHDRVGDVGSEYALDVARALIPRLVARGYVFAAPVLAFSPMHARGAVATCDGLRLADVDGDGRSDACVRDHDRVTCTPSVSRDEQGLAEAAFDQAPSVTLLPPGARAFELGDVSGDGHADVCAQTASGISCAVSGKLTTWSKEVSWDAIRLADIDGDGRADACGRAGGSIFCARSTGAGFEAAHVWQTGVNGAFALGDVNGDGLADLCFATSEGIECAISTAAGFARPARWSREALGDGMQLADVNGDGRADVCARGRCALSTGHAFTASSVWADAQPSARLGDINGDGRSDVCECDGNDLRCAVAP